MKKLLLIFLSLPLISNAQRVEVAVNAGISINSKPTNDMFYRGDNVAINYGTNMSVAINLDHNIQVGLDGHVLQLSRMNSNYFQAPEGVTRGDDGKQFVYSKITTALCLILNKKIDTKHGYFYGGVAMGFGIARNFHKTTPSAGASYIAPDGGHGPVFGGQVGYTYYFARRWALDVEGAVRDFDLDYDAHIPVYTNPHNTYMHYRIIAYTATAGIKFALGFKSKATRGYTPDEK